jgi:Protein of unknown function (DUF2877)
VIAHVVAAPVLERVGRTMTIAAAGRGAAYVDVDGFVVAVTAPGVPLLPNAVSLTAPLRDGVVQLEGAAVWDPVLRLSGDVAGRGAELLSALGCEPAARDPLARAVEARDPALAAAASRELLGRGSGLTPEGDDRLAATAAVVAARGWPEREAWLGALVPPDVRERTTALSATLLALAAAGRVAEPVHGLFGEHWRAALERLTGLGHSTGRAYATAAATAALLA